MTDKKARHVLISQADLANCTMVVEARFTEPAAEAARTQVVRELLAAVFALEHAVREHSRCALVNHYGTHGTNDLAAATDTLFEAMLVYAAHVRNVAARFAEIDSKANLEVV